MNILINFSAQKTGGGQNVALNFVLCLLQNPRIVEDNLYFLVAKGSKLDVVLTNSPYSKNIIRTSGNPIVRCFHEFFYSPVYLGRYNIDIIYTYFGWGIFPFKYPQISGSAASWLFFPEIDFWAHYNGLKRLKNKLIDKFRVLGLRKADGVVFETPLLEKRFHELFNTKAITKTIKPSISLIFSSKNKIYINSGNKKVGLFLCGWQLNKNILLIPDIAAELKLRKIPFIFVISATVDDSIECRLFFEKVKKRHVEDYINVIGYVDKSQLESLYHQVDLVFLLSKIESFSNNIIESWTFRRPLVIADEPWSRNICEDAAVYVKRDSVSDISDIIELYVNGEHFESTILRGIDLLKTYPTIEERTREELMFIKQVYSSVSERGRKS